jgi:hypothetical protein
VRLVPGIAPPPHVGLVLRAPDVRLKFHGDIDAELVNNEWSLVDGAINWFLPQIKEYMRKRRSDIGDPTVSEHSIILFLRFRIQTFKRGSRKRFARYSTSMQVMLSKKHWKTACTPSTVSFRKTTTWIYSSPRICIL